MITSKAQYRFTFYICLGFFTLFTFHTSRAQEEKKGTIKKLPFGERIFYGGNFGLQFGNYTLVDVSPMIGYRITSRLDAGIGGTYKYYSYKTYSGGSRLQANIFGGNTFTRFFVFRDVFAYGEYEYLYYKVKDINPYSVDYTSLLVGAGYRQPVSERSYMYIMLLWNLNDTPDSPYSNPVIRVGFSIGN